MAQPTYYPLWSVEDTTLPNTSQTNKIRPKTTLREIGWDKGQIPSAEEFNWLFNNVYQWILYLNEEALPTYLPITGTELTFTGDITGTATWNGEKSTSVELSSETLNAATSNPTVSTLVKRSSTGSFSVADNITGYAAADSDFSYLIYDQSANTQEGSLSWDRSEDVVTLYKGTTSNKTAEINLSDGLIELTSPRSLSEQGTDDADLTRKDYVDGLISDLTETVEDTYVTSVRLGAKTVVSERGNTERLAGGVMTTWADYGSSNYAMSLRPLQYQINGTWYTAAYLS